MILVAPDKFKGTLTANQVAKAISHELRRTFPAHTVVDQPIADGGEGTVDLAISSGLQPVEVVVTGPLGQPTTATYATDGVIAVIEAAEACGLALLQTKPNEFSAANASTFGVGELIDAAIARGCQTVIVGLGGSATTDGGAGMVEALGAAMQSPSGQRISPGGAGLPEASSVDLSAVVDRLAGVDLQFASDVDNPLVGPEGAAAVYGPQKGAGRALVRQLDAGLSHWAAVLFDATSADISHIPGAGAAGGTAAPLLALGAAVVRPGADLLMDLLGFDELLGSTDLLVVGEGSLDQQSLRGKGPVSAARRAKLHGVAVAAVAGHNNLNADELAGAGIDRVYAMTDIEPDRERCLADAERLVEMLAIHVARSECQREDWPT